MIFGDEQELPFHSAGQRLFWQKCVHEKLCFTLVNWETNLEKYGAFLYNDVCTHTDLPERMKPMADTHIKYNDHSINSAFKNHYIVPDYTETAVEIEHIMPQTCTDKGLYGMNEEEFSVYINRLGNLTLLENTINRSIQNDVYANKATYYKQSKFYITSSISELVNLGQDTAINRTNSLLSSWSDWNKQAIEERQEMFYRLSEMIWELR